MERAARRRHPQVIFEVDSMLLARQMARYMPLACKSESLVPYHRRCVELAEDIERVGNTWDIRHMYREFNQVADALSNQAIDEQHSNGPSPEW